MKALRVGLVAALLVHANGVSYIWRYRDMFKYFKRKELIKEITYYESYLDTQLEDTVKIREDVYYNLHKLKVKKACEWSCLLKSTEGKNTLFPLLMHKQFIGYLFEQMRQKTHQLYSLDNKAPSSFNNQQYFELIENSVAKRQMNTIFQIFEEEMALLLEKYEKDIS
ncbi:hypothetical protein [Shewanella sp. 10N.286.52.A9]|uniref:hypothetical protein n=1 Tax=Shewanella sp. 10N.286.52.A9 TaxID=3229711 RepID=UPI00354F9A47